MLDRIWALLTADEPDQRQGWPDAVQVAAAALLVEAARMDEVITQEERDRIEDLVRRRFGLDAEAAATLRRAAEEASAEATQWYGFAAVIRDRFSAQERVELIEMLWEVAYADGELHDLEASLLRRIGGLLYVSDRDRGAARKRVLARLGIVASAESHEEP